MRRILFVFMHQIYQLALLLAIALRLAKSLYYDMTYLRQQLPRTTGHYHTYIQLCHNSPRHTKAMTHSLASHLSPFAFRLLYCMADGMPEIQHFAKSLFFRVLIYNRFLILLASHYQLTQR